MLPSGPQFGVPYVLTGPDGTRAVFNDPTDADYIGMITDLSGLDSPDVRENGDVLTGQDGGIHGNFYYGRRPITISGLIPNPTSTLDRNNRTTKLLQATNALRADATLTWTPDGGEQQQLKVRRQQPVRITGAWVKDFQIPLVAADPRIYSSSLYSTSAAAASLQSGGRGYPEAFPVSYPLTAPSGRIFVTNQGSSETFPMYYIFGPGTNPRITNVTNGAVLPFLGTLAAGDVLMIDTFNRTVTYTTRDYSQPQFTNQVLNGSFEYGTTNWGAFSNSGSAVVAQNAAAAQVGATGLRTTFTSAASGSAVTYIPTFSTTTYPNVSNAINVAARAQVNVQAAPAGVANIKLSWRCYNSSGALISEFGAVTLNTPTIGQWNTMSAITPVSSLPAGTVYAHPEVNFTFNGAGAQIYDIDAVEMYLTGALPTAYFDGDTVGARWLGAPGNSASQLLSYNAQAGAASRYSWLDFNNVVWGGVIPGQNDIRLGVAANLGNETGLRVDYRDAWI